MALTTDNRDTAASTNSLAMRDGNGDSAFRILTLSAVSGGLNNLGFQRGGVAAQVATFTIDNQSVNGVLYPVTTGASNRTANLPAAAASVGQVLEIVKVDTGVGTVIVDANGGELINGVTTQTLVMQYEALLLRCDGTGWQIINWYKPLRRDAIGASTAAAGSTTSDAGVLPAGTADVYPTTAADGTKGVRIHANDQVTGRRIFIGNGVSNQILKVYAPSGGVINGASADAAYSSASGKGVLIICLSSAGNTWLAIG